jgi:hypothetical protein
MKRLAFFALAPGLSAAVVLASAIGSSAAPLAAAGNRPPSADRAAGAGRLAAVKPCSRMSAIASCVMKILAPAGGTHGVYLKKIGGSVLAAANDGFAFEPASSIKALIGLYALTQVEHGKAQLTEQIPMIDDSGGPDDCPPNDFTGTEPLGYALEQMLQVSDNNRTDELMQFFGVSKLNAFAASLGLAHTMFQTSPKPPGFNVIGCLSYPYNPLPATVDGNTMSLDDAAAVWTDIAKLPAPYADTFYELAAGRDMFNTQGYDFTGIWPALESIAQEEAPSGLSTAQLQAFIDHMTVSVKGGSYAVEDCTPSCDEATWWVFAGNAEVPACRGSTVSQAQYAWGYFINDAVEPAVSNPDNTKAGKAFFKASGQLLAAPIAKGLANWASCSPAVTPTLSLAKKNVTSGPDVAIGATLARLADSDNTDISEDLTGTINWGDGSASSFATLTGGKGAFTVHGWHAYTAAGSYPVTITVKDIESGNSATVKEKIKIT